jgi:hypothetical protein
MELRQLGSHSYRRVIHTKLYMQLCKRIALPTPLSILQEVATLLSMFHGLFCISLKSVSLSLSLTQYKAELILYEHVEQGGILIKLHIMCWYIHRWQIPHVTYRRVGSVECWER